MENHRNVSIYTRLFSPRVMEQGKGRNLLSSKLTKLTKFITSEIFAKNLFIIVTAFLMGRALLFNELAPFGFAYWAYLYREERQSSPLGAVFLLLGGYTARSLAGPASLLAGMFVILLLDKLFESRKISLPLPLIAAFAVIIGRGPYLLMHSFIPYDIFLTFMEVVLVVPATAFISFGVPLAWPGEKNNSTYKQEEIIGGLFFFAFLMLGLANGPSWVIILQSIVVNTTVLVLAYLYGGALGAAAGLTLALFLGIGNPDYVYISMLSFAGLLSGVFREAGKVGTVSGFLLGLLLCSFYIGGIEDFFYYLPQAGAAAAIFILLPTSFLDKIKGFSPAFSVLTGKGEEDEQIRKVTSEKLIDLSKVFKRIADSFKETAVQAEESERGQSFFKKVGEEACNGCGSYRNCWEDNLAVTCELLKKAINKAEGEKVTISDISFTLRKRCRYINRLLKTLNTILTSQQLEAVGQQRFREGRSMVVEQLEGVSGIVFELANEVKLKLDTVPEKNKYSFNYSVELGVSQVPKEGQEVSGDYYSLLSLKEGKQVIILSDGMGSGNKAKEESKATVSLLEDLLEIGFSRDLTFKTVNTVMQLRSCEETFATVDLALVDLIDGNVEICKIGAAPSFLKRGKQVKEVSGASLPIGILAEIEMETKVERLVDGDMLIMLTDGISEAGVKINNSPNWVKRKLMEINHCHPQIIADILLEEACHRNKKRVLDDMTIIVCKMVSLRNTMETV